MSICIFIYFEPKPKKKSTKKFSNKKKRKYWNEEKKIAKINWNKKQENWRQIPCKMYRYGWILVEKLQKMEEKNLMKTLFTERKQMYKKVKVILNIVYVVLIPYTHHPPFNNHNIETFFFPIQNMFQE